MTKEIQEVNADDDGEESKRGWRADGGMDTQVDEWMDGWMEGSGGERKRVCN